MPESNCPGIANYPSPRSIRHAAHYVFHRSLMSGGAVHDMQTAGSDGGGFLLLRKQFLNETDETSSVITRKFDC